MRIDGKRVLVCDCEGTMSLDGTALGRACGSDEAPDINTQLCRAQLENFRAALGDDGGLIVACTQEAPLFAEAAGELAPDKAIAFANIRERAGWADEGGAAGAKIAALLAEAAHDVRPASSVTLRSEGVCLVYGKDDQAIEAAKQLAGRLDVTVLLSKSADIVPPRTSDVPIFRGTVAAAKGHLGAFDISVNGYAPAVVSSRDALAFATPRDGAMSRCDLILDLTGGPPLFPAPEKRDGYFNPDPGNPAAVQRALFELSDLVGEFEKPRYVDFTASLCAHSRSRRTGCTRCLDVCPASAIQPAGDHVEIDPFLCGGCGGCNSVCPTGAASYAMPANVDLYARLRALLTTYHKAGGKDAELLIHDDGHGGELISYMARFGRGLPANLLPFEVNEVTQVGFDFLALALAYGAGRIVVLAPPKRRDELGGLAAQIGLAEAVMDGLGHGGGRIEVVTESDPDAVEERLYDERRPMSIAPGTFLAMGGRREVTRLALSHLHARSPAPIEEITLPPGAPFGTVEIEVDGCTLCLACVGACPTGALIDNPDRPQLSFQEDACIQCGLCRNTCPEHVITLRPRYSFSDAARGARLVKEEEPFECVRCGKPFGTKSSIERIVAQLAQKHPMFQDEKVVARIRMCEDCRVIDQFEATNDPMRGAPRPVPRTTDDYLREPEIEAARQEVLAERGKDGKDDT